MTKLHLAHTNFEWEIGENKISPLEKGLEKNPIFLQLQFLPFLYANAEDFVGVTEEPEENFWKVLEEKKMELPKLQLIGAKQISSSQLETWGPSRNVAIWAKEKEIPYIIPSWDVVALVNSKEFSFTNSPKLPGSALLSTEEEANKWLGKKKFPAVLKTCFGVSGRGHLHIDAETPPEKIFRFLHREWQHNRPVIAEPWMTRTVDFSTQWEILPDGRIEYLGATICENDAKGKYLTTRCGDIASYFGDHFEEHVEVAKEILKKIAALGYFGNVGIDAMLYTISGKTFVQPIVEINARKTMGWVALQIHKRHFAKHQKFSIHYLSAQKKGFLPKSLKNSQILFTKQLLIEAIE